jgi:DNA polymerase-3 subunit gamma/tau
MYQVLARKWRPQSFDELVGQAHVAQTLSNAIESDRLAHAYIFAGLRGTGKTTVARILSKCLNCEKGPTTAPCGTCSPCTEIAGSRAMDVLEIDAASRTKVEQTRELLEVVSYAPVRDRYKVLIIDEAHMLSKASFNALLKTLEEPPPNVVFILATTELHKVLSTITSRCQVFEFRRVAATELTAHLRRICEASEIAISDSSLERLARAGEGSVRDSLSLVERVLAFCGQQVEDADVLRLLGAVRAQILIDMVGALALRDAAGMLTVLDGLLDEGHDLLHFWVELIAALRDLLLLDALPERPELLARPADEAMALKQAADGLTREDLTRAFQIVADLEPGLKTSAQPQFLFEATLIRLAGLGAVRPIEELLAGLPKKAEGVSGQQPTPPPRRQKKKPPEELTVPSASTTPRPTATGGARALVEAVRASRPMLAAILGEASAIDLSPEGLRVVVPSKMDAIKRQLEQKESLALLGQAAEKALGKRVPVRITLGDESPQPAAATAPVSSPEPPAKTAKTAPAKKPRRRSTEHDGLLDEARQEPGVRKLLDSFGAQVVEISPLEFTFDPPREPDN